MLKSSKALAAEEGGNDAAPKSYDVVVVGSGGATAAAIQAHDEGASVLIVEKCRPLVATPSRLPPG